MVRRDHTARYEFARTLAKGPILDAACGIGYGAHALGLDGHEVTAVDIEPDAIKTAVEHYCDAGVRWICGDLMSRPWRDQKFKTIVSFETLEHLDDAPRAVELFRNSLALDGLFIASVPNQEQYGFDPDKFKGDAYPHRRHYTPDEFTELLTAGGFRVAKRCTQMTKQGIVTTGSNGIFLIFVAEPA